MKPESDLLSSTDADWAAGARRFACDFNYTSCNEDGDAELRALAIHPGERVLCVTGGGDRPLHLLLAAPAEVVAIDANPAQNALLAFKVASLRAARDWADWVALLGLREMPAEERLARLDALLPDLPPDAAAILSRRRRDVARGILWAGRWERYFAYCARNLRLQRGRLVRELLAQDNLDAQRAFVRERWDTPGWRAGLRLVFCRPALRLAFGDPGFYAHVPRDPPPWRRVHERINAYLSRHLTRESFMLELVLLGRFTEEGRLPPYLRPENFETLRARAGRIRATTAPLGAFLASDEGRAFDVGSFSDVPSFLSNTEHEALFAALASGGFRRFCVREFLARRGAPPAAYATFSFDPELRASLEADDASLCYDFLVGERR